MGRLCGSLDLDESLALLEPSLLLEAEDLEALEVGECLPPVALSTLLGPVGLLPLGVDLGLFPELLQGGVAAATVEALNLEVREKSLGEGDGLADGGQAGVARGALGEHLQYRKDLRSAFHSLLRAPSVSLSPPRRRCGCHKRTRLWSIISTTAASLPASGWSPLIRMTRPTSTRRQAEPSINASPIVVVCEM